MIILGVILIIIGALADIGILYTIGGILAVVGLNFWILGATGNAIGGRNHWFQAACPPHRCRSGP